MKGLKKAAVPETETATAGFRPGALRIAGVSAYTGLSVSTIKRLKKENAIPYTQVNRSVIFPLDAIDRWLRERTVGPACAGEEKSK